MVLLVVGTGTGVGKTYVGQRLLLAASALGARAYGYKPVESGIAAGPPPPDSDIARLEAASSFHVKPSPARLTLRAPISPHLAARDEGAIIDLPAILTSVAHLRTQVDLLLVELPGGAFSPFTEDKLAIDVAREIPGAEILLVASDRLGVLHDIGATALACAAVGAPLAGLVLSAPEIPDSSTGRNAPELARASALPLLASLPRKPADAPLAPDDAALTLAARFLRHARPDRA